MADKKLAPRKNYRLLRRYLSGLTALCVVLVTVGGIKADASFYEITVRAFMVWFGLAMIEWAVIRAWSAWEVTSSSAE